MMFKRLNLIEKSRSFRLPLSYKGNDVSTGRKKSLLFAFNG
jgi:hypothetical protein